MSEEEVNEAPAEEGGENAEWELARRYVEETGRHLFLTGRAGTGKTTFLKRLKEESPKRMVVAAPTGVAAINAGGVTLHSFFQLPLGVLVPGSWEEGGGGGHDRRFRFSREKRAIVQSLDLLVIDEISMVRADVLDAVDEVLRRLRGDERPFGGVQLLMIGDLRQLPPVAKDEEWALMQGTWPTAYFFGSRALAATEYRCIELRRVYRQKDASFVALLNDVRAGAPSAATLAALNGRCSPRGEADGDGGIVLCTHNAQAQAINEARLEALPGGGMDYAAQVTGTFPEASWPTEGALRLKPGAQVMFVKNDPDKRFFNGRIGRVTRLEAGRRAWVRCEGDAADIDVGAMSWENLKYTADPESGQLKQEVAGTFSQLPLKLAWAITVHKSQGLTFDRVRLLADRSFAPGQVYVALSRCRTLEGLALERPIPASAVMADPEIDRYVREIEARKADAGTLLADRLAYRADVLAGLFRFRDLARPAYGLRRLAGTDPGALAPGVPAALEGIYEAIALDMERVGDKFAVQLRTALEGWTDPDRLPGALAARLEKGAEYYLPRLREQVLDAAAAVDVSTDNRAVGVALKRDLGRLADAARAKIAAMEALREGDGVADLLRRVAGARFADAAETSAGRAASRRGRASGGGGAPPPAPEALENAAGLIQELRAFRSRQAKESHWPAYAVFSQKTLYGIAERLPLDLESLARVPGMGRSRAEKYAADILPLVRAHAEATGKEGTTAGTTTLF
jgi:hypothetical protein